VDRIAAAAGVNKQLVFYYYATKRGLFHAALREAAQELDRSLATATPRDGSPLARLEAALATQFDYLARNPDLVALLTHGTRVEAGVFAPAIRRLVVLLAEGQGLGQVRGDVDPHVAAAQALVLMLGYLRLEPMIAASAPALTGDTPGLRARWMRSAVALFLAGVRMA
jgi:AcrR family transcriptional regulator